jgi:membrane protein implicated in regulation of membrane protease activity
MLESMLQFWLLFGAVLVFGELVLPGLVSVFVGLGALSVAALLYLNLIESLPSQLATWFVSSTIYIFTIRILVVRFYPSDTEKQNIDEDQAMMGRTVDVIESISSSHSGRVRFGESTWTATLKGEGEIRVGEKAVIVGRDNILWIVKKMENEEI